MIHIGLVGFWAVAFVIKQGFGMIKKTYDVRFTLYVRDADKFHKEYHDILSTEDKVVVIRSLNEYTPDESQSLFGWVDYLINTSIPSNNLPLMKIAQQIGATYIDLASVVGTDMFGHQSFPQMVYHTEFVNSWVLGIINAGISPGITECIIAEIVASSGSTPHTITIYLQEHLYTNGVLPSWSPITAIEELTTNPARLKDGEIQTAPPFNHRSKKNITYQDWSETINVSISHYPLFQEELMSIYQQRPTINNINIRTGGGEVEEVKTLIEFGVLSDKASDGPWSKTLKEIFIHTLPSAATKGQIIQAYTQWSIDTIYFGALIDINMMDHTSHKARIAFDENCRTRLKSTPCRWATYISYPTGIATVCMIHNLIKQWDRASWVFNVLEYALAYPGRRKAVLEDIQTLGVFVIQWNDS